MNFSAGGGGSSIRLKQDINTGVPVSREINNYVKVNFGVTPGGSNAGLGIKKSSVPSDQYIPYSSKVQSGRVSRARRDKTGGHLAGNFTAPQDKPILKPTQIGGTGPTLDSQHINKDLV